MDEKIKQELINTLVKNERNPMSVEEATAKVNAAIAKIDEVMADESEETRTNFLKMKVKNIVASANVEKYRGICVGVGDKRDILDYSKKQAMAAYKANPQRAVADGIVRIDGDNIIPIDTKEFFDAARTKRNKGFGKPIGTVLRIESYFLVENEDGGALTRVNGEFDSAEIGMMYEIFGSMNDKGMINVPREPGIRAVGKVDPAELWNLIFSVGGKSDAAVTIERLPEVQKYSLVVTSGTVRHEQPTANGHMLVIEDDGNYDVACFATGEAAAIAATASVGNEVVVIGKATKNIDPRTGEERTNIFTLGVIVNPDSGKYVKAMKDLDDVFLG